MFCVDICLNIYMVKPMNPKKVSGAYNLQPTKYQTIVVLETEPQHFLGFSGKQKNLFHRRIIIKFSPRMFLPKSEKSLPNGLTLVLNQRI